jgi:long-chain acyl-CoA synthetase
MGTEPRKEGFWKRLKQVFTRENRRVAEEGDSGEDDLVEILYTSGTTGHSKGVMLTQRNLISNALAGAEKVVRVEPQDVLLSILPQAHAFGGTCAFLTVLAGGGCIHYLDKKPSPKVLLAAMKQVRPTVLAAVPLVFEKIYHKQVLPSLTRRRLLRWISQIDPGRAFLYRLAGLRIMKEFGGRLRCAIIGGAGLNHEVESFLRQAHIPYILGYGLTECAPLVSVSSLPQVKFGSVGPPIPSVEIRVVDPDPSSGVGEILVRGPSVMQGYYKNEEATRAIMVDGGWLDTGDLGRQDRDGHLYITGRTKNVIIGPSGENTYPEAVEDLIKDSPFVEEVLVHEASGQIVARIYPDYEYIEGLKGTGQEARLALDVQTILEQVRREVNAKLPPFSRVQKVIEQREPFLKTPTKKIKRAEYLPR